MKNYQEEEHLKKVNKQIWWVETEIGSLNFLSGKVAGCKSHDPTLLYLPIAAFLFIIYIILDKFLISRFLEQNLLKWFFISSLILLSLYLMKILDKKASNRIDFLEKKLSLLRKEKRNLTDIINNKS